MIIRQLWTWNAHTLGFRATHSDGTVGFVMSGHCGGVGVNVWQPTIGTNNLVGRVSVNPLGPRSSDAAFVPTTDVIAAIWLRRPIAGWQSVMYTPVGTAVKKEGIATGYTSGFVYSTGVTVNTNPIYSPLWSQVLVTYHSAGGDSGAPVFGVDGAGNAIVYGIHVGRVGEGEWPDHRYYSPVDGIWRDLWVRWGSQ